MKYSLLFGMLCALCASAVEAHPTQPAKPNFYDLKNDLAEQKNLIAEPAHADRVKRMEATYRAIRASKRSVDIIAAAP